MKLIIRDLGLSPYHEVWDGMKRFTKAREKDSLDELWLVEHPPVYTLGLAGKEEHLLSNPNHIPVIKTDRGGQITYHGPGQLVIYPLLNLHRLKLNIRCLVSYLENTVINWLKTYDVKANNKKEAPGVYVEGKKIASIGIKVSRGYSYHGIALNLKMDLTPFSFINPCGYEKLKMCQFSELAPMPSMEKIKQQLINQFNLECQLPYQLSPINYQGETHAK